MNTTSIQSVNDSNRGTGTFPKIRLSYCLHILLVVGVCSLPECGKGGDSSGFVVADWVKEHKPAVEKLRSQLDAAVKLAAKLPIRNERVADSATPIKPITDSWKDGENMVILRGSSIPGLPGSGDGKGDSKETGVRSISIGYTGYVDLASAFSMVDKGNALYIKRPVEGRGLAKKIAKIPKNFGAPRAQKLRELDQRGCANCRTSLQLFPSRRAF